jgi:hypothetical protein
MKFRIQVVRVADVAARPAKQWGRQASADPGSIWVFGSNGAENRFKT